MDSYSWRMFQTVRNVHFNRCATFGVCKKSCAKKSNLLFSLKFQCFSLFWFWKCANVRHVRRFTHTLYIGVYIQDSYIHVSTYARYAKTFAQVAQKKKTLRKANKINGFRSATFFRTKSHKKQKVAQIHKWRTVWYR